MYDFTQEEERLAEEKAAKAKERGLRRGKAILTYLGIVNLIGIAIAYIPYIIINLVSPGTDDYISNIVSMMLAIFIEVYLCICLMRGVTVVRVIYAVLSFITVFLLIFVVPVFFFLSPVIGVLLVLLMAYKFFFAWQLAFNKNIKEYARSRQKKI